MGTSSKLRRTRKIINAAVWRPSCLCLDIISYFSAAKVRLSRHKALYIQDVAAYIYLHLDRSRDPGGVRQPQSAAPQANRRLEPPSRACSRALVSERGILRCSRFGAGEVRDVASRAHRGSGQDRGRHTVWCIATDVLPSRSGLRARGLIGAPSQAPRSQRGTQAHARRNAVYRSAAYRRGASCCPSARSTDRDRTGCVGPPPQHRTRPGAQKKR